MGLVQNISGHIMRFRGFIRRQHRGGEGGGGYVRGDVNREKQPRGGDGMILPP